MQGPPQRGPDAQRGEKPSGDRNRGRADPPPTTTTAAQLLLWHAQSAAQSCGAGGGVLSCSRALVLSYARIKYFEYFAYFVCVFWCAVLVRLFVQNTGTFIYCLNSNAVGCRAEETGRTKRSRTLNNGCET